MVSKSKPQISAKINPYLLNGIDKLIQKEPIKDKSLIVNEALDMYLRAKGVIEDDAESKKA